MADAAQPRDLMAPDTEPTDEELALVMREARDLAVQRRAKRYRDLSVAGPNGGRWNGLGTVASPARAR